jgi:hypothetical protein
VEQESRLFTLHNLDKENRRSEVRCLVFDRDAIVSGDSDFMVKIWDWNTGQPRFVFVAFLSAWVARLTRFSNMLCQTDTERASGLCQVCVR